MFGENLCRPAACPKQLNTKHLPLTNVPKSLHNKEQKKLEATNCTKARRKGRSKWHVTEYQRVMAPAQMKWPVFCFCPCPHELALSRDNGAKAKQVKMTGPDLGSFSFSASARVPSPESRQTRCGHRALVVCGVGACFHDSLTAHAHVHSPLLTAHISQIALTAAASARGALLRTASTAAASSSSRVSARARCAVRC